LVLANKLSIINRDLEVQREGEFIYIPLMSHPSKEEQRTFDKQVADFRVQARSFSERKKPEVSLVELLEDRLPPHLLGSLPRAVDFVGDIAIVEIPPDLDPYRSMIGEALLKINKNVRTVLTKAGPITGTYRLRELSIIAGEPRTETVHKEYGCQYYVDVAKVYFSPRLSFEHKRVASQVGEGEVVVDMFAGVGPFSIQVARTHENVAVYAIDVNRIAVEYLKRNISVNRTVGKVHPILGDARQVIKERLAGVADRVIMNLPESAMKFVDSACQAVKPSGGTVHFYAFVNQSESLETLRTRFIEAVEKSHRKVEKILFSRFVRETAPFKWQAVLDAEIC
jgi:tRNA (guanine37-N1)-methyltransferase